MAPRDFARPASTDGKAVGSLLLGLASFALGPVAGIPAIVLGSAARRDIERTGGPGVALARAGTMSGFFGTGFFAVFVLWVSSAFLLAPTEATSQVADSAVHRDEAKAEVPVSASPQTAAKLRPGLEPLH